MPEPIGIAQTVDAVNNMNVKAIPELILTNAIATQKAQQDEQLANTQVMNAIRQSSAGQIVNRMNSLDPLEASAVSRVHRTPSGDAGTDAATVVALAQALVKGAQTIPPITAPPPATGA